MNHIELQVPDTVIETALAQVDEESGETADGNVPETEGQGTARDEEGLERETASKPGIDRVLTDVAAQLGDQYADVIKGLQGSFVQNGQLESKMRKLDAAIAEVEDLKGDISEQEDLPDPLADVPEEQLALLDAALKRGGYVTQDSLDERTRFDLVEESNEAGVAQFGEEFGAVDEVTGEFFLNEDAKELMAPVYDRIKNQDALTFHDLHVLSNIDGIIESAYRQGADAAIEKLRAQNSERVGRVQGVSRVASRNAAGVTQKPIYDPEAVKGLNITRKLTSVMENAYDALRNAS